MSERLATEQMEPATSENQCLTRTVLDGGLLPKYRHHFAERQRELAKKRRKEEKRQRKAERLTGIEEVSRNTPEGSE